MSNNFLQMVKAALKSLIDEIEKELSKVENEVLSVLAQIWKADEQIIVNDAWPIVQNIAIQVQNEKPGLNQADFIASVISAAVPALQAEGLKLATADLNIIAGAIAKQQGISETTGNAGTVS